jgi:hypothetical protein
MNSELDIRFDHVELKSNRYFFKDDDCGQSAYLQKSMWNYTITPKLCLHLPNDSINAFMLWSQ